MRIDLPERQDVFELARELDILDVALALGAEKARGRHTYSCVVCHGSDCSEINPSKSNNAVCYSTGCAEHQGPSGYAVRGPIDLTMHALKFDPLEAARWLCAQFGIIIDGDLPRRTPSTPPPPPRRKVRQKEPLVDPEEVEALTVAIWERVRDVELTREARAWLEGRGIDPGVAWELGCRDFSPVAREVLELVKGHSNLAGLATGWRVNSDHAYMHPPLLSTSRGSSGDLGLTIPSWLAGAKAPICWRWRFYRPTTKKTSSRGRTQLGATLPEGARWSPENARVLFICEGEPDWLSVYSACAEFGRFDVACIGVCNGNFDAKSLAHFSPEHIILATHQDVEDKEKEHGARKKRAEKWSALKATWPDATHLAPLVYGHDDLNDMHKRGALVPWLASIFAHIEEVAA